MKRETSHKAYSSLKKGLITGVLCGGGVVLLLCMILAFFMTKNDLGEGVVSAASIVVLSLGAFVCGFTAARINSTRGLIVGVISGLIIFTVLTVVGIIVCGFSLSAIVFVRFAAVLAASVFGGIAGVNVKRKPKIKI